ncbi:MAG: branched-chain amino acid aminotransferase [Tissierellia bacterium]|nr:branched-chain amino acid aminotransferase [Tissierellia bacterium]
MERLSNEFYLIDEEVTPIEEIEIFDDLVGKGVYEVIKVQKNVPMFLEDHLERFFKSIDALGYKCDLTLENIKNRVDFLIDKNPKGDRNLKLIFSETKDGTFKLLIFFIDTVFPDEKLYKEGIKTVTINLQREDPNIKIQRNWYKEKVGNFLKEKEAYEALLVDDDGFITEGSRSNIFYVIGDEIITTQGDKVLLGITREYVLKVIEKLGYKLVNKTLNIRDLKDIDGVIMTGTGVGVIPISTIDSYNINSTNNKIINLILENYNKIEDEYINNYEK